MALHVTLSDVQQWIEQTKLTLSQVDADLEDTATTVVFSQLGMVYDTTDWTDELTTPLLVRKIIAMLIAAWTMKRQYAEDETGIDAWADTVEVMANELMQNVLTGVMDLLDVPGLPVESSGPSFFPNNSTGSSDTVDAQGNIVSVKGSEDIKFRMGTTF